MSHQGTIDRYRKFLPVTDKTPVVSLQEGNTPLILSRFLTSTLGLKVYLKYEGLNPTGSFKDRGMTMAISKAKEEGSRTVMCASTGNTSASAAAYAARAEMKCIVLIPDGNIALGKLAQAMIHQAKVIAIQGNFDEALTLVKEITSKYPVTLVNSINPYRIEGQKTAAFEVCDDLGDAPEFHAIPVGNAGNITAYWKGYQEYKRAGKSKTLPRMLGFQAAGAAPIVKEKIVKHPETLATAIKIGNPANWKLAEAARDESQGLIDSVTDREIIQAYKMLAGYDGVFVELASAASVAGILKLHRGGYFKNQQGKIVCTLTGHGLKDPQTATKEIKKPIVVKAQLKTILKYIGY
ncbi:MAG TPA: threonine synthase [Candidatus Omnitrophota bacterium]|nr:threonine synthase [Candidatus Omnitrophota bacterium]